MALKIVANTGGLSAREKEFFSAIADLYIMLLYGQLKANAGDAADTPGASDALLKHAAQILATKFAELDVRTVQEDAVPADATLLN